MTPEQEKQKKPEAALTHHSNSNARICQWLGTGNTYTCTLHMAFPHFQQLPFEIRRMIWRLCLPDRVRNVYCQAWPQMIDEEDESSCNAVARLAFENRRPPTITQVCHESRMIAYEDGGITHCCLDFRFGKPGRYLSTPFVGWRDEKRELCYLNLRCPCEINGDTVEALGSEVKLSGGDTAAIRMEYLICQHHNISAAFQQLSSWFFVLENVYIHSSGEAIETGLFGLLGDAPVQIVGVTEEKRMKALMELALATKSPLTPCVQQFCQGELEQSMWALLSDAIKVNVAISTNSIAQPTICFFLCKQKCVELLSNVEVDEVDDESEDEIEDCTWSDIEGQTDEHVDAHVAYLSTGNR